MPYEENNKNEKGNIISFYSDWYLINFIFIKIFSEYNICLPIRLMIVPLKKRFSFHFSSNRRTNRLDRPEWFLTQILSWLRDHLPFLSKHLQVIVDGMDMRINVQVKMSCIYK